MLANVNPIYKYQNDIPEPQKKINIIISSNSPYKLDHDLFDYEES